MVDWRNLAKSVSNRETLIVMEKINVTLDKCQEYQESFKHIIFKDTEGGVQHDIRSLERKKVSWKALSCVVGLVIAAVGILYGYQLEAKDTLAQTYVKAVEVNTENILKNAETAQEVLSQQLSLLTNIDWIKKSLLRIEKSNDLMEARICPKISR